MRFTDLGTEMGLHVVLQFGAIALSRILAFWLKSIACSSYRVLSLFWLKSSIAFLAQEFYRIEGLAQEHCLLVLQCPIAFWAQEFYRSVVAQDPYCVNKLLIVLFLLS